MPPSIRIEDLLAVTNGRLLAPTAVSDFAGASVDSRRIVPGSLFVALAGERADGHTFVPAALGDGAMGALVARPVPLPRSRFTSATNAGNDAESRRRESLS